MKDRKILPEEVNANPNQLFLPFIDQLKKEMNSFFSEKIQLHEQLHESTSLSKLDMNFIQEQYGKLLTINEDKLSKPAQLVLEKLNKLFDQMVSNIKPIKSPSEIRRKYLKPKKVNSKIVSYAANNNFLLSVYLRFNDPHYLENQPIPNTKSKESAITFWEKTHDDESEEISNEEIDDHTHDKNKSPRKK